jgi:hypothetical protein
MTPLPPGLKSLHEILDKGLTVYRGAYMLLMYEDSSYNYILREGGSRWSCHYTMERMIANGNIRRPAYAVFVIPKLPPPLIVREHR